MPPETTGLHVNPSDETIRLGVYECPACHIVLRPKPGDCCVFCSYADQQCPPKQCREEP